jgi:hypothetical protein
MPNTSQTVAHFYKTKGYHFFSIRNNLSELKRTKAQQPSGYRNTSEPKSYIYYIKPSGFVEGQQQQQLFFKTSTLFFFLFALCLTNNKAAELKVSPIENKGNAKQIFFPSSTKQ